MKKRETTFYLTLSIMKQVISISRDGSALIWNVKDGKKISQLEMTSESVKYIFKRCRYFL